MKSKEQMALDFVVSILDPEELPQAMNSSAIERLRRLLLEESRWKDRIVEIVYQGEPLLFLATKILWGDDEFIVHLRRPGFAFNMVGSEKGVKPGEPIQLRRQHEDYRVYDRRDVRSWYGWREGEVVAELPYAVMSSLPRS
jgi:hypothetical protein